MNDHLPRPARIRPGVRRAAIAACIVLLPFAVRALWEHVEMRRLLREMDGILAKGEPVVESGFTGTTDEHKRSATQYLAAAVLASQTRAPGRAAATELAEWIGAGVARKHSDAELAEQLKGVTDAQQDALRLTDSANRLEFRGFNPGHEFSYRTSSLMLLAQVVASRTLQLALDGRGDEAAQSAVASLRLRPVANDLWMSVVWPDHQVPPVLSLSSISEAALRDLQGALEASEQTFDAAKILVDFRARMLEAIVIERWIRRFHAVRTRIVFVPPASANGSMRPWLAHQLTNDLQIWDEMIDAARRPWPEKVSAVKAVRDKYAYRYERPVGRQGRFLPRLDGFVPDGLRDLDIERFVGDRASRIAVAITRYRLAHGGRLPASARRAGSRLPRGACHRIRCRAGRCAFASSQARYTVYSVGLDGDGERWGPRLGAEGDHQARHRGRRLKRGQDVARSGAREGSDPVTDNDRHWTSTFSRANISAPAAASPSFVRQLGARAQRRRRSCI